MIAGADPTRERSAYATIDELYGSVFGGLSDFIRNRCPPPPNGRGRTLVGVTFANAASEASMVEIRRVAADQTTTEGQWTMVVVDGVDQDEATALGTGSAVDLPMLADPDGRIAARPGISIWPTTVRVDAAARAAVVSAAGPGAPIATARAPVSAIAFAVAVVLVPIVLLLSFAGCTFRCAGLGRPAGDSASASAPATDHHHRHRRPTRRRSTTSWYSTAPS